MDDRPRVLAVLNASSGTAAGPAGRAALAALAAGADLAVARTRGADDLRAAVEGLDGRRLVVLGGDGSLSAALAAVRAVGGRAGLRGVGPVGLVPLGTGNDLARSLRLPVGDPAAAARTALSGRPVEVELVEEDGGGVVVNAAHAGLAASASARALALKPLLRRAAYPVGALVAGASARPRHLRVVVDGRVVHDGRRGLLLVAVTVGASVGGGARLSPTATPHDGLVDVVVSTATGPLARTGFAAAVARGRHVERPDTATTRGADVEVEAVDGRPFAVNADGDLTDERTRFRWRSLGDAWRVLVP